MTGTPQEPRGADWTAPGVTVDKDRPAGAGESLRAGSQTWIEPYLCPLSLH